MSTQAPVRMIDRRSASGSGVGGWSPVGKEGAAAGSRGRGTAASAFASVSGRVMALRHIQDNDAMHSKVMSQGSSSETGSPEIALCSPAAMRMW